ncbi:MAG TPA: hypothetical protein VGD40_18820 [Chryseosolibacter sp.]
MLLEDIAVKCLVNSHLAKSNADALTLLKNEFAKSYPTLSYENWNKELPEALAQNIITNVGKNGSMSVRFLIKDLETIATLV